MNYIKIKRTKLYYFYLKIRYDIPNFIRNVWYFRKPLYNFRSWDYSYTLEMLKYCLSDIANSLENNGNEIIETRSKKIEKIRRAVEILDVFYNDGFIHIAEQELNLKLNSNFIFKKIPNTDMSEIIDTSSETQKNDNNEILNLSAKIEKQYWNELWEILKGNQDNTKIKDYLKEFNGTDIRGWWN
jgi:hypothetical protein